MLVDKCFSTNSDFCPSRNDTIKPIELIRLDLLAAKFHSLNFHSLKLLLLINTFTTGRECALLGEYAEQEMMAANFQSQLTGE